MNLDDMKVFYYVVHCNGFVKAAKQLNVSKSYISKRVMALEQAMAVHLLHRKGRKLQLTQAGEALWQSCRNMIEQAEMGIAAVQELQGIPAGRLKVSLPPAVACYCLASVFAKFSERYPEVLLDLHLESRVVDIIAGDYDLVLRASSLDDSSLIATKLLTCEYWLCATPEFIARYNSHISEPEHLRQLPVILHQYQAEKKFVFTKVKQQQVLQLTPMMTIDQISLIKSLVLEHVGFSVFPDYVVANEVKEQQLIRLLPEYQLPKGELYAIYPEKSFMPPKLRVFIDFIKDAVSP